MKKILLAVSLLTLAVCCGSPTDTIQVGENTFVHSEKVYRIIENEITELGDLRSDSLAKSVVQFSVLKNFGRYNIDYLKANAYVELKAVYRGDVLYIRLDVYGLNDLKEKYTGGGITLDLLDNYNFYLQSIEITQNELTQILGTNNQILFYQFNGKAQMSSEVYKSIFAYSVSSSIRKKGTYNW